MSNLILGNPLAAGFDPQSAADLPGLLAFQLAIESAALEGIH
jgi:hypothetical protein